ncbi:STAS domain-containing protein [Thiolinea disciformis]|uniref:STAS domain-containing protein n=1 Tax=Thiolinea disciformis TaxID=125614 RepID=UPI0003804F9C|nr:STAS domain-containing protein [Thiolinea disciformis]
MRSDTSIKLTKQGNQSVITLQGPFDHDLARNIVSLVDKLRPPVIFDMRQVSYMTTAGSRLLLGLYEHFGTKPILRQVKPEMISLLRLSGTFHYVTLAEDPTELSALYR